jgi:hypothetical protein
MYRTTSDNALKECLHQIRNRTKLLKIKKSSGILELKKCKENNKAQLDAIERQKFIYDDINTRR